MAKLTAHPYIMKVAATSPEPLRAMVYLALGEDVAMAIDGTALYLEVVDHIEELLA